MAFKLAQCFRVGQVRESGQLENEFLGLQMAALEEVGKLWSDWTQPTLVVVKMQLS